MSAYILRASWPAPGPQPPIVNPSELPTNPRPVLRVHHSYDRCSHGAELTSVSSEGSANGWLIWGHYLCRECDRVLFDHRLAPPGVALIAGRYVPILLTSSRDSASLSGDAL
jgi:hypothetical protein